MFQTLVCLYTMSDEIRILPLSFETSNTRSEEGRRMKLIYYIGNKRHEVDGVTAYLTEKETNERLEFIESLEEEE
jgi:hypothetical protein